MKAATGPSLLTPQKKMHLYVINAMGWSDNPFRNVSPKAKTIVVSQSILLVLLMQYGLSKAEPMHTKIWKLGIAIAAVLPIVMAVDQAIDEQESDKKGGFWAIAGMFAAICVGYVAKNKLHGQPIPAFFLLGTLAAYIVLTLQVV